MPASPQSPAPAPGSAEKLDRLRTLLREMFQLDRGDLDFGLYRIMRMKSAEIKSFLDDSLLPQVQEKLEGIAAEERERLEKELAEALAQARELGGIDPEETDKVKNLRRQLKESQADAGAEADVYNHLANFFSRYYSEGDFMSLRRYSSGGKAEYLIPYNGEEVKLHWANADQYYIKTTENYASYAFSVSGEQRVRFEITAAENSKDNVKESNGKQRRFLLAKKQFIAVDGSDLIVRFEHRPLTDGEKKKFPGNGSNQQNRINANAEQRILDSKSLEANWRLLLATPAPTKANGERTVLAQHLERYTAKNSFDYFIHKDLGGFLRRELDLYLKNEVLNLDDLDQGDTSRLGRALARMRATRFVAEKIITFLAQLEDFQKRLWLKKKFVLETQYCVTVSLVPEKLYPEIIANKAQIAEWKDLLSINKIKSNLIDGGVTFSEPLTRKFLKSNPSLMLDTRHFEAEFTDQLLATLTETGTLDNQINGLLVHGENFQALNLLQNRYCQQVDCIYLDPPYNTGNDGFAYKDSYRHSSWMSMMHDRLALCHILASPTSGIFVSTDDGEYANIRSVLGNCFGESNFVADVIWNSRKSVSSDTLISVSANHTTFFAANKDKLDQCRKNFRLPHTATGFSNPTDDPNGPYKLDPMDAPNVRENLTYPILNPATGAEFFPPPGRCWRFTPEQTERLLAEGRIVFGRNGDGRPLYKRYVSEALERGQTPTTLWNDVKTTTEATKLLLDVFGENLEKEFIDRIKPKPTELIERCALLLTEKTGTILDCFAGSGTTGHAVINLNQQDGGQRKYILAEMADYFETALIPRIKKIVYSEIWKNGRPIPTAIKNAAHIFKYIRLESYEDTLNNLELTPVNSTLLDQSATLREDYQLRYSLNIETAASPSLLGRSFKDPFAYTLSALRAGALYDVRADLPETFNYLIGLRVETRKKIDSVLTITGTTPEKNRCLILWRNLDAVNNSTLESWFIQNREQLPNSLDFIYVNGDNTLNAIKLSSERWVAKIIEPVFRELMFPHPNDD